jgi:hypothetical protein
MCEYWVAGIRPAGDEEMSCYPQEDTRMRNEPSIVYKLDADGGFTAGDRETGFTSYAYPSSIYAMYAKNDPQATADRMMKVENDLASLRVVESVRQHDERNWVRLTT